MSDLDLKSKNFMDLLADFVEQLPQEQRNTLIQENTKEIHPSKNQWGQVYKDDLVVMQNRMLHAISHLTLNERRLVLMLATVVRGAVEKNPAQKTFTISANEFGKMFNITNKKRYDVLQEVSKSLHGKVFYFWDFESNAKQAHITNRGKRHEVGISWIGKATYKHGDGKVELLLIDDVIEMLCIFDQHNAFTKHKKEWITKLGAYGLVLLQQIVVADRAENIHKGKDADGNPYLRSVTYTIEFLREKFDCVDRYQTFADFKRYVIDKAVKEIEQHTPYQVDYDKITEGRSIVALTFRFMNTDNHTITQNKQGKKWDNFKLTKKQLDLFGKKIAQLTGDSTQTIIENLSNVCTQQQYRDLLEKLDFQPTAWYDANEIQLMTDAHQQAIEKRQYEAAQKEAQAQLEKEKEAQAQLEKAEFFAQIGWYEAVKRYEEASEELQNLVIGRYMEEIGVNESKNLKSKLKLAKKLSIDITAIIEHHQAFIAALSEVLP